MPPSRNTNVGAKRAREARADLGLSATDPLPCVLSVVEHAAQVPVAIVRMRDGIAGYCLRKGERAILWVNGTDGAVRQRFTLAHEFGHLRCGHDGSLPPETFETLSGKITTDAEVQANAFAAEFLAPAATVGEMAPADPNLDDVVRIAARFGISSIAALYRLNTLELAPRYEILRKEIEAGHDSEVAGRLALAGPDDVIGALAARDLPRLSPVLRDSALASGLDGSASVDDVAGAAGCDPGALSRGMRAIAPPRA